ncbi:dTDP-4-dehydrorhamnose reductase [Candidatus Symbiobacter mobilis]|uniref:dTDP-4-dehydrorhamnose reductase n=1 Tax=Candidatus Symbiobacter mobilis CR TaxID=946483 RepID=U5N859_9BURK|nr:dTDP-4-dehydrorhamnose reductase [Candidatus Symbiobacter mobilis]AGX87587.1 dTDP-4-dehydrorhamnose reductase [Candidatus Symbiobacter mobilis CR]
MKLLLLGKDGQVGWELQRSLAPLGILTAVGRHSTDPWGNFDDMVRIQQGIETLRPDVIVNAAAYTAVDKAEQESDYAFRCNALVPEALARAAHSVGAWFVHYSSDYVYPGTGNTPWIEDDEPSPANEYGRGKCSGDRLVAAVCPRHLILRTSWVYAARGHNFLRTMLRLFRERHRVEVVHDQFGAPTGAELLADITACMIRQVRSIGMAADALAGIYHVVPSGETTWYDYALHILQRLHADKLSISTTELVPVPSSAFPTAAYRPRNSRLNTRKVQDRFGLHLPPWQAGVDRVLDEVLPQVAATLRP